MELNNVDLKEIQNDLHLKEEFIEKIIDEYSQSVLNLSYTYVKEPQLAEEITQDVFLTCYNKLDNFQNRSSLKTWMYRITVNKCKDHLRKKTIKQFLHRKSPSEADFGAEHDYPESVVIQKYEKATLSNKVMSLPMKFKEVIFLYYFEEMNIKEIGHVLNVNINTVKTRLSRGRNMLRKMYEKEEKNEH